VAGELQEVLLRVLEILAAEGELRDQLGQLHRELWRVLHASNLYVALYDEPTGLYFFPYNADPDDQDFTPQALRKSLTDYVRRTAEPLLCREAEMDQLVAAGHIERIGLPSPVWLGAPLVTPRGCLGAVVVQHYTDAGALGPGDVDTLAAVARCMAVAVERSWLEERRRAEHEMRLRALAQARDEAVRSSQAKSQFLANMSHELRTPLNAILGYTDLLLEEHEHGAPALVTDLGSIRAAASHLRELIDGVLDLTQVESGNYELAPTRFALTAVVDAVLAQCAPLARRQGDQLLRSGDEQVGELVTDRRALLQILLNLVANACKFTTAGRVALRCRRSGDHVSIEVSDTGVGIDPARLGDIFEPFVQLDGSSTRAHGGTGLGLTIAARLARELGGELSAASVPGSGSTFTLTVPAGG
jgi:signal transduction histidine kinase